MAIRKINSVSEGPKRGQEDKKRMRRWGNIFLFKETLTLPEGVTHVGDICLIGEDCALTFPEGVIKVGSIDLCDGSSLIVPKGVTQVEDIELDGSSSLILPKSVTKVRDIVLRYRSSFTLPEGVTKVRNIALFDGSSLTLSKGVTKLGRIKLDYHSFFILPDGYVLKNSGHGILEYSAKEMNRLLSEHQKLQGQRIYVIYPEDVLEGRPLPLPMSVEGRLASDGKVYVSFSDSNRIIPEDGLILVKNPHCNIYETFDRKTFDLLYQMNPDGSASRKKQSETMKPEMRKKSSLKK